jgi:hypothetical protein
MKAIVIPLVLIAAIAAVILALAQRPGGLDAVYRDASAQATREAATSEALIVGTATPIPPPTATRMPIPPELQEVMTTVELQVSELRGLNAMADVPEFFLTREQFRDHYKRTMQENVPIEEVQQYIEQLYLLRLVSSPAIDFYETSTDLYSDGILGYYDHISKELYVVTDRPLELNAESKVTLAHEFVHSLQDQHYKLKKIWPTNAKDRDRNLAIQSLVEGDATLSGYAYAANYMNGADYSSLFDKREVSQEVENRTPPYLSMTTIFPYTAGTAFAARMLEVARFSTINLALTDPPRSTEQIMHPEKFLQTPADHPKAIGLPDIAGPLGQGWELKETNTLGEFDLNMMLRLNGASDPDRGADGWGGGKFAMYKLAQEVMVYAATTWDTLDDASQFTGAMTESFGKAEKQGEYWVDNGRHFWMHQNGKRVTVISSTNRPALERVVGAEVK